MKFHSYTFFFFIVRIIYAMASTLSVIFLGMQLLSDQQEGRQMRLTKLTILGPLPPVQDNQ